MSLDVNRRGIEEILTLLKKGEWQIPQFQREYVWSQEQIKKLVISILKSYPIGLITLWDQPQNDPHTPGEPLKLKNEYYKDFTDNPAVIKLVLDGKQRLTTLAMVFGGFNSGNGSYSFSGYWYFNLQAYIDNDELKLVLYKKKSDVNKEQIDTVANCLNKMLIPFKDFAKLSDYIAGVNNPDIYPDNKFPSKEEREKRVKALSEILQAYTSFSIPFAQIPSTITLGNVCEIFDVLNTTGTKVSTFDLIHNLLFKESDGSFVLRDKFKNFDDMEYFGLLCDENRQEFYCQTVTGCYCVDSNKVGRNGDLIRSIKGPDLVNTPLSFYNIIDAKIDSYNLFARDLFENILFFNCELSEIPYPASIILYFALRWKSENSTSTYKVIEINKLYKAFYWRNVFCQRYDQGFLTQFSKDLEALDNILIENHSDYPSVIWCQKVNEALDNLFGSENEKASVDNLKERVVKEDTRGALKQGFKLFLKGNIKKDIVTRKDLDWSSRINSEKVEIHHIFPRDWCKNNKANNPIIELNGEDNIANCCPLQGSTNNVWKANSPATAIKNFGVKFDLNKDILESAFINEGAFEKLKLDSVEEFWDLRAQLIAEQLYKLQDICL